MIVTSALVADSGFDGGHMNGWDGGWMWLWGVVMMTFLAVLITGLVRVSSSSGGSSHRAETESGREILAERYAKGELTTENYHERLHELQ